ncbi:MAG TPA: type II toxin-antitoxin system PemK/MazF family toxin, partial [Caulobacteraceae bacterium]|nr:type II toxin-antitoxin system PemK/MazF family toxin [Caulobacteraceae bacterium]
MKKRTSAKPSARSSSKAYAPDEGDIVWVQLSPTQGQEQSGHRPALVLTPAAYNRAAKLCVICALTNQVKGYPFEVALPGGGVVLADQVRTIAWPSRDARFKEKAPPEVVS